MYTLKGGKETDCCTWIVYGERALVGRVESKVIVGWLTTISMEAVYSAIPVTVVLIVIS